MKKIAYQISKIIPDKLYLQMMYYKHFHKFIDFKNPKTFNEKINWLKLYDRRPEYTQMVDKYTVREYIAERLGEEYLIPLLGVWDDPHDIDFDALPNQFVLKWNHDSGSVIICKDKSKLNIQETVQKLASKKNHNGFWYGREWPYKNVKPKVIAEKYMVDESGYELKDYKFFAFDGFAKAMFIASDRQVEGEETKFDFFDMDFKHLPFTNGHPNSECEITRPQSFEKMKQLAEELSRGIPQLRVDFYEVNGQIYFGELTFSHWSGFKPFNPTEWDSKFGEWIELPENSGGYLITNKGYILWIHETTNNNSLTDYKFYCFKGVPRYLYVSSGLHDHSTAAISFLTMDWEFAPFGRSDFKAFDELPIKPSLFEDMKVIAAQLAKGHDFLRVDLYQVNGKIYFSELTFSPCAGLMPFVPKEWDNKLGDMLTLTESNKGE